MLISKNNPSIFDRPNTINNRNVSAPAVVPNQSKQTQQVREVSTPLARVATDKMKQLRERQDRSRMESLPPIVLKYMDRSGPASNTQGTTSKKTSLFNSALALKVGTSETEAMQRKRFALRREARRASASTPTNVTVTTTMSSSENTVEVKKEMNRKERKLRKVKKYTLSTRMSKQESARCVLPTVLLDSGETDLDCSEAEDLTFNKVVNDEQEESQLSTKIQTKIQSINDKLFDQLGKTLSEVQISTSTPVIETMTAVGPNLGLCPDEIEADQNIEVVALMCRTRVKKEFVVTRPLTVPSMTIPKRWNSLDEDDCEASRRRAELVQRAKDLIRGRSDPTTRFDETVDF